MANLFTEFQGLLKGVVPQEELLVPLLIWLSGSEKNIELCQKINRQFYNGNRKVFISELTLHNSVRHIIRYPKVAKENDKLKFFYNDICKYFDWTTKELQKNMSILDIEEIKPVIAKAFGYDNKERHIIKIGGLKYGSKKKHRKEKNR